MYLVPFDALKYAKKLRENGFTAEQAEEVVITLKEIMTDKLDAPTVKDDFKKLEDALTLRFGLMLAAFVAIITALVKL